MNLYAEFPCEGNIEITEDTTNPAPTEKSTTEPSNLYKDKGTQTMPKEVSRSDENLKLGMKQARTGRPGYRTTFKQKCNFCWRNGETPQFYLSHPLEEDGIVRCPILRMFVCNICGKTGDEAHTPKYCPEFKLRRPNQIKKHIRTAVGKLKVFRY